MDINEAREALTEALGGKENNSIVFCDRSRPGVFLFDTDILPAMEVIEVVKLTPETIRAVMRARAHMLVDEKFDRIYAIVLARSEKAGPK